MYGKGHVSSLGLRMASLVSVAFPPNRTKSARDAADKLFQYAVACLMENLLLDPCLAAETRLSIRTRENYWIWTAPPEFPKH